MKTNLFYLLLAAADNSSEKLYACDVHDKVMHKFYENQTEDIVKFLGQWEDLWNVPLEEIRLVRVPTEEETK